MRTNTVGLYKYAHGVARGVASAIQVRDEVRGGGSIQVRVWCDLWMVGAVQGL